MSTHATIAITDGVRCKAIYLHWDGYLSWAGKMLYSNYNSEELAKMLISLGALSVLKERLAPNEEDMHTFEEPLEDITVAYCRDRGEPLEIESIADMSCSGDDVFMEKLADISGGNYVYLFDERKAMWLGGVVRYFLNEEKKAFPEAKPLTFYPLKAWFVKK